MILIAIDAVVLMGLLQAISNENVAFFDAFIVAIVASIATFVLALALVSAMGVAGVYVAAAICATGIGIAVSAMYGVEIKRAMAIGVIFMVVHIGASLLLQSVFG